MYIRIYIKYANLCVRGAAEIMSDGYHYTFLITYKKFTKIHLRDRPFNLQVGGYGFLLHSEFFFQTTRELEYLFFCRAKRNFFFQNLTLGYMTNTLNQIIIFSSTKIRISFSATLGIRIFF